MELIPNRNYIYFAKIFTRVELTLVSNKYLVTMKDVLKMKITETDIIILWLLLETRKDIFYTHSKKYISIAELEMFLLTKTE